MYTNFIDDSPFLRHLFQMFGSFFNEATPHKEDTDYKKFENIFILVIFCGLFEKQISKNVGCNAT